MNRPYYSHGQSDATPADLKPDCHGKIKARTSIRRSLKSLWYVQRNINRESRIILECRKPDTVDDVGGDITRSYRQQTTIYAQWQPILQDGYTDRIVLWPLASSIP